MSAMRKQRFLFHVCWWDDEQGKSRRERVHDRSLADVPATRPREIAAVEYVAGIERARLRANIDVIVVRQHAGWDADYEEGPILNTTWLRTAQAPAPPIYVTHRGSKSSTAPSVPSSKSPTA